MRHLLLTIVLFAFLGSACAMNKIARAEKTEPAIQLTPNERAEFVDDIIIKLQKNYLHESVIHSNKNALRRELMKELNKPFYSKDDLALRLTKIARSYISDKHLEIRVKNPANYDPVIQREEAAQQLDLQRYKIGRVEVKSGVGYLEMIGFANPRVSELLLKKYVGDAFIKLNDAKALIIDLRKSGGGSPEMVATILSFVLEANTPINEIHSRDPTGRIFEGMKNKEPLYDHRLVTSERTSNGVTIKRFMTIDEEVNFGFKSRLKNVPIAVLTSANTLSAPEELAYDLQQLKRAIIVGEKTAGGANPRGFFKLAHGLEIGIPSAEAKNPISKDNWEQRGVEPDVLVPSIDAFDKATELLLAQIK